MLSWALCYALRFSRWRLVSNDVSGAYARSDLLALRRVLMARWAAYYGALTPTAQVLPIHRAL
jgi:hypothetical protein